MTGRTLIAGIPRAGKTTLSEALAKLHGIEAWHTDVLAGLGWSESSAAAAEWISKPGPWIIEGVSIPRALRKWLAANEGAPCEVVHWMPLERIPLSKGQTTMALGCITVWSQVVPELIARGVQIVQVNND
jgi:adenylate kinase family enzyme